MEKTIETDTGTNQEKIVELDNWRAVTEEDSSNIESVSKESEKNISIKKYVEVLAVFGGMDLEGHFYNDLMVLKLWDSINIFLSLFFTLVVSDDSSGKKIPHDAP